MQRSINQVRINLPDMNGPYRTLMLYAANGSFASAETENWCRCGEGLQVRVCDICLERGEGPLSLVTGSVACQNVIRDR